MEKTLPAGIRSHHLRGRIAVYVRQSSPEQVRDNTGSTEYQRGQKRHALAWGIRPEQIDVLEGDLGLSGSAPSHRRDYLGLREGVRDGTYTMVLVSNLKRLGRDVDEAFAFIRDCKDRDALIVVDGRVFDTRQRTDLLQARLQAIFAELDRDSLREQMEQGRQARLEQGFAVTIPPAGYRNRGGRWELDPRPEVQTPLRLCFMEFLEQRSLPRTVRALRAKGIRLPRWRRGGDVEFVEATVAVVQRMVTNPAYRGDYHYGRRRADPLAGKDARGKLRLRKVPNDAVYVVHGHHEALVPPEVFDDAQRVLAVNRWTSTGGSMGRGAALLQGAVYCEVHRRMMSTLYANRREDGQWSRQYKCIGDLHEGGKQHTGVPGLPLEAAVERELVSKVSPPTIERLKEAWDEARQAEASEAYRAKLEMRRRQAEVHDLEYRYLKADPDNTRVRCMLEDKLEEGKRALEKLEKTGSATPSPIGLLDERGFQELLAFAADFRAIFHARSTTNTDRKEILRTMVESVVVEGRTDEVVKARIVWKDGSADTTIEIYLSKHAHRLMREYHATGLTPEEIVRRLNDAGILTKYGTRWCKANVGRAIDRQKSRLSS
jgi:DNA invertase Pin-like site-specific DNA recombinase